MFKKISLCLAMVGMLGLGSMQLVAGIEIVDTSACCPETAGQGGQLIAQSPFQAGYICYYFFPATGTSQSAYFPCQY